MADETTTNYVAVHNAAMTTPGTRVETLDVAIRRLDPTFDSDRLTEVEYEFPGRTFKANPKKRHPYNTDP